MKILLLALTFITLTFLSCSNNDDDPDPTPDTSLYQGSWSGTYSGDFNGTFTMNVKDDGTFTVQFVGIPAGGSVGSGTVTETGTFNMTFLNGGMGTGAFNAETDIVIGDYLNPHPTEGGSGSFEGTKN